MLAAAVSWVACLPMVGVTVATATLLAARPAHAQISIDWVKVGDPGNTADTTTYGSVAYDYWIMKHEFTNTQYAAFLNSVAQSDPYSLYNSLMASGKGGITRSGSSGSYTYTVRANMGDKPANIVSWFDAARVSNWLQNGATGTSSTETGAYTLVGGQTSGATPALNPGAKYYIPLENEWYKAAYYKGGGTNAGYWTYAMSGTSNPGTVTANSTGVGSAGPTGESANWGRTSNWGGSTTFGNVTSVGTNGGPSPYGTFDMSGNVWEWNSLAGAAVASGTQGYRGGWFGNADPASLARTSRSTGIATLEGENIGFRLVTVVPEPSALVLAGVGLACAGWGVWRRRRPQAGVEG